MPTTSHPKRIDELIEKAMVSLNRGAYFECERMGIKALSMARQRRDFERMIKVAEVLMDVRQQRLDIALSCGKVTIFDGPVTDAMTVKPGCFLIQPPQVGADARRLRLAAFQTEVPVAVVCREPVTSLKLCPIVAICPGTTIRTQINPPRNLEKPTIKWFTGALEALGESAIESVDQGIEISRRIDATMERLDALPEHTGLHQLLIKLCRDAIEESNAEQADQKKSKTSASGGGRKRKLKS